MRLTLVQGYKSGIWPMSAISLVITRGDCFSPPFFKWRELRNKLDTLNLLKAKDTQLIVYFKIMNFSPVYVSLYIQILYSTGLKTPFWSNIKDNLHFYFLLLVRKISNIQTSNIQFATEASEFICKKQRRQYNLWTLVFELQGKSLVKTVTFLNCT